MSRRDYADNLITLTCWGCESSLWIKVCLVWYVARENLQLEDATVNWRLIEKYLFWAIIETKKKEKKKEKQKQNTEHKYKYK